MKLTSVISGPGFFRFLLALIVVIFHVNSFIFFGKASVYVFFILSGYWVSKIFTEEYKRNNKSILFFYESRVIRIMPTYYIASIIIIAIHYYFNTPTSEYLTSLKLLEAGRFVSSNLILLGYASLDSLLITPAWSLDIEMQFYLLLPFILLLIRYIPVLILTIASALGCTLIYIYNINFLQHTFFQYSLYFLIGICLYKHQSWQIKRYWNISLILFVITIITCVTIPFLRSKILNQSTKIFEITNLLIPLILYPFIAWNIHQNSNALDRDLGNYSYPLYLIHYIFVQPYKLYSINMTGFTKIGFATIYLVVALLASLIVYIFFDRPINIYRKKTLTALSQKILK